MAMDLAGFLISRNTPCFFVADGSREVMGVFVVVEVMGMVVSMMGTVLVHSCQVGMAGVDARDGSLAVLRGGKGSFSGEHRVVGSLNSIVHQLHSEDGDQGEQIWPGFVRFSEGFREALAAELLSCRSEHVDEGGGQNGTEAEKGAQSASMQRTCVSKRVGGQSNDFIISTICKLT